MSMVGPLTAETIAAVTLASARAHRRGVASLTEDGETLAIACPCGSWETTAYRRSPPAAEVILRRFAQEHRAHWETEGASHDR
ncbi:MAG TPA: hypothetical protein VFL91_08470 [Thermomicrobiales bacterium]|nr:hypothetical protein [Thermomicrobiales bacterium]